MSRLAIPVGADDHVLGRVDAPVTLCEYGDYECPHCARAHAVTAELLRRRTNDMRFAFRHFPLRRLHPHAGSAAQAAEAAASQGQFWPMHSMLFEHQDALEPEDLLSYARALDLDVARFAQELQGGVHLPRIERDFRSGARSGVNGTPTFFVNDERLDGPWDLDVLQGEVTKGAKSQRSEPRAGVT
ncbi:MAG TPA: thioredoxin domain-containing protein [Polyangiaceae bacterium]|jgi:protein-disulfide isomerase|nr:thioredoxin domain-containing protein [Polyangiaceae bacterium]